ncbi:ATP-dependent DNA helicase [Elysia marginata]|uniref:ATP-dependent DNA helicase n=1 Tax=Elysia marginata TaxID=1093978 RepID=A0AAV4I2Q2_9GAST|nr:ATP-dependent DNA helicase [Elysia marginata]
MRLTCCPSVGSEVCLVNVQSVRNKTTDIADLIEELSADIAFLTESWLYPSGDEVYLYEITPVGYTASSYPRLNGRKGGICVLSRKELNLKSHRISRYHTFERCECTLSQYGLSTTFFCLYRPPPNQKNRLNAKDFLNEFQDLLDNFALRQIRPIFLGDFNLHFDNDADPDVQTVKSIISSHGLHQIVNKPTHRKHHILDWVVTDSLDKIMKIAVEDKCISDHYVVTFDLDILSK